MYKVLIVDDELLMRIGLKSMIRWEDHGFHLVGEADNGKEALDMIQRHAPDIVITDIKMPVMDGLVLMEETSRLMKDCQFIILSVLDEFQYVKQAMKLGAMDYLIKSELKPKQLLEVLGTAIEKIKKSSSDTDEHYKLGIHYLKETLFKEMLSGFRTEMEIRQQCEKLNIEIQPDQPVVLLKLRIRHFEVLRKKYVEKDERLLRYAVTNILEEMIPRKWKKEVMVEHSAEYLILFNTTAEMKRHWPNEKVNRLLIKIEEAMKDFLNISVFVAVSSVIDGLKYIKVAYKEAEIALKSIFFNEAESIVYFENIRPGTIRDHHDLCIDPDAEKTVRLALERKDYEHVRQYLQQLKEQIVRQNTSERAIRKIYIRWIEIFHAHIPNLPDMDADGKTPYEHALSMETFEQLHSYVLQYVEKGMKHNLPAYQQTQTYAESAIRIIQEQYRENLTLQTVADQINVNPSYFSRIFKQETGENFVHFLAKVRIDKAKYLLTFRHYKVYEVADLVGYQNTTYFSKIFKKMVGVSPEEYGQAQRGENGR